MDDHRRAAAHSAIRAVILLGFGMYIVYLTQSGHLFYYIAPRMQIYVKVSALALYAMAVYQGYSAYKNYRGRHTASCDCDHTPKPSFWKNGTVYGLFLLPVLLGFLLPDTALGSALAAKKGMNLSASSTVRQSNATADKPAAQSAPGPGVSANPTANQTANQTSAPNGQVSPNPTADSNGQAAPKPSTSGTAANLDDAQLAALFKADQFSQEFAKLGIQLYKKETIKVPEKGFVEVLSALDLFTHNFIGKKIDISGFVYREEGMRPDQFAVARFQIQCCSADATPLGIVVEAPDALNFAKDSWVHLTGTIGQTDYNGNTIIKIDAAKMEKIQAPENVYVQPEFDYDFMNRL